MATKNRAARLSDFRNGITVWEVSSTNVIPRLVMGKPFKVRGLGYYSIAVKFRTRFNYGKVDYEFLGDAGVPGCSYDKRPPRFHMSKGSAERSIPRHIEWREAWAKQMKENSLFDSFLDYDYEEDDTDEYNKRTVSRFKERGTYKARPHEVQFKYESDHKEIRIDLPNESIYGSLINSKRIRLDFVIGDQTPDQFDEPRFKFLASHKGQWYIMDANSNAWLNRGQENKKEYVEPVPASLQEQLQFINVINDTDL